LYFNTSGYSNPPCLTDEFSGGFGEENDIRRKRVNGCHIRRKSPFIIRAFISYKGQPVSSSNSQVRVYDGSGGPCSIRPIQTFSQSINVLVQNISNIVTANLPVLDLYGNATSFSQNVSYFDLGIRSPNLPQDAVVFVKASSNGASSVSKMNLFFPSTLKIELNAFAPDNDSLDIKEQFAKAYLLDPDNPQDLTKITLVRDGTIARWQITRGNSTSRIPFYSIDNVPLSGVFSYFNSGTARNVFFGPASVSNAGLYTIRVSTNFNGLSASAEQNVEIKGRTGSNFEIFIPDPDAPRILCEFENIINYIWADGVDYQKMTITRNPLTSNTKYSQSFRDCSVNLLPLPPGISINIEAKDYEIITGDVVELTDVDGNKYLNTNNATVFSDYASIKLGTEDFTYVYFRINKVIEDAGCREIISDNCAAFDVSDTICKLPYSIGSDKAIILNTKINIGGKPKVIFGGGHVGNDGKPPCVLVPVEPLYVKYLGLFVGNNAVNEYAVDGQTVHDAYFEIKYKEKNLNTGTPVNVFACNILNPNNSECEKINNQIGVPNTVYVYNSNTRPGEGVIEGFISLIKIPIGPISNTQNIAVQIYPEIII
jgi:hypothetical protein